MDSTEGPTSSNKPIEKPSEKPIQKKLEISETKSKENIKENTKNNTKDTSQDNHKKNVEKKTAKPKHIFKQVIRIIAIIALVLAVVSLVEIKMSAAKEKQDKKHINQTILQLQEQTKNLEKLVHQAEQNFSNANEKIQTVLNQGYYLKQDWLLYKARNYLELAQIHTNWSDDPKIAIVLLQSADTVLSNMKDQKALNLRQSIAKEIAELKAVPQVDISGLLSQLDGLQTMVMHIPLADKMHVSKQNNPPNKEASSSWRGHLQQSLQTLGSLVVVKHYEGDLKPMLSPIQQALSREMVRMNLQEAQWAILHNQVKIYQASLEKALQHIHEAFDVQAKSTQSLISELQQLQKQDLSQTKPSLSQSLELINQWIDSEKIRSPETGTEGEKTP
jgi:uroporphyrin-3 C-methyltransferase